MPVTPTTVHGFAFVIDTMDWTDEDSANYAADLLVDRLDEIDAIEAARLHGALVAERDGRDLTSGQKAVRDVWSCAAEACREETFRAMSWATKPSDGHNCYIAAA